jgi:hypothetical protein
MHAKFPMLSGKPAPCETETSLKLPGPVQVGVTCCGVNERVLTGLGVRKSSADGLHGCPGVPSRQHSEGLCSIFCARPCSARGGVLAASCIKPTQRSAQYRRTRQGQQHCSMPSYSCQLWGHADELGAVYDMRAVTQKGKEGLAPARQAWRQKMKLPRRQHTVAASSMQRWRQWAPLGAQPGAARCAGCTPLRSPRWTAVSPALLSRMPAG